ncbi:MAG: PAS domain S-box protein [Candidatus Thiodiazotropha taylori]
MSEENNEQLQFLLLEDNLEHAELFRSYLELTTFRSAELTVIDSLQLGLDLLQVQRFDLLFLDLSLGDSDINHTMTLIPKLGEYAPVIVVTSLDDVHTILDIINKGADDCLPKIELKDSLLERIIRFNLDRWVLKQKVIANEKNYLDLYDNSPDMRVSVDARTAKVKSCNQTLADKLGYKKADIIDQPVFNLYHPNSHEDAHAAFEQFVSTGIVKNAELQLKKKNGEKIDVLLNVTAIRDKQGNILRSRSTLVDITEEKKLQENLRLMQYALNSVNEAAFLINESAELEYVNVQSCTSLGYTKEEMLNLTVPDIDPEHQKEVWPSIWQNIMENGAALFESTYRKKSGVMFPVEISANHLRYKDSNYILAMVRDVTERKRIENELRSREKQLSDAQDVAKLGYWELDVSTYKVKWSKDIHALLGTNPGIEIGPTTLASFVYEQDWPLVEESIQDAIQTGKTHNWEYRVHCADGQLHWLYCKAKREVNEQGRPLRLKGILQDITDRKQVEIALRESQQRLHLAGSAAYDLIYEWDCTTNSLQWFGDIDRILGFPKGAILHNIDTWLGLIHSDDREQIADTLIRYNTETTPIDRKYRVRHADGNYLFWHDRALPVLDKAGSPKHWVGVCTDITRESLAQIELEKSHANLVRSENRFHTLVDNIPGIVYRCKLDSRWTMLYISDEVQQISGYSADELLHNRIVSYSDLIHPEDQQYVEDTVRAAVKRNKPFVMEYRIVSKNGGIHWVYESGQLVHQADLDEPNMLDGVILDISKRKLSEEKLKQLATVFTHAQEAIMVTDADAKILEVNNSFERITGYKREEVVGKKTSILSSGRHSKAFFSTMWRTLLDKGHWKGEIWNRQKSGRVYVELLTISSVYDDAGEIKQFVALFSDVTERKEHEQQLEYIAHFDALTNLPNRLLLADRLHLAIASARRRSTCLAVAYIDLDGFKEVNDVHGHDIGDVLLVKLAKRMKNVLRESDTIARMGGDEFVAVVTEQRDKEAANTLLSRVLLEISQPVLIDGLTLQVTASIGVSFFPDDEQPEADQLLRQADQAMYSAKLEGKSRLHIFDSEADRDVRGHHESLGRIEKALTDNEFVMYYQPKVNMHSGEVIGVEALIRWNHPHEGLLTPNQFLPIIEETPVMVRIDKWVLKDVLAQMNAWKQQGLDLSVSINVSGYRLQQPDFLEHLEYTFAQQPYVKPESLTLEILETSALEDIEHISRVIHASNAMGMRFSLDDFGTGYSSLTYLRHLPVQELKIDQSFVRDMLDDSDDLAIIDGMIGLSRSFNRMIIAEGVETLEHGMMLLRLGCEHAQGYEIAMPMPAEQLQTWLSNWYPDPLWTQAKPLSTRDIPVLFAGTEHRSWIRNLTNFVHGNSTIPPIIDEHNCPFGKWLDSHAKDFSSDNLLLQEIKQIHEQIHHLGVQLINNYEAWDVEVTDKHLVNIYTLRDRLLNKINSILHAKIT